MGLTGFCYIESLPVDELHEVVVEKSDTRFKFGNGSVVKSLKKVTIPAVLAGVKCLIKTDVVDCDVPLLFGKPSMAKAKVKLDFEKDCASILGRHVKLECTPSGHYCIPIFYVKRCEIQMQQVLMTEGVNRVGNYTVNEINKLHKQLGHPSSKRLIQLLKSAGMNEMEYFKVVEEVTNACDICTKYKRTSGRRGSVG